ncbi:MAG: acyl-CoA synthetase [Magnetovibrio sp.]|nr:acyl-CoA synthetase [Magnetovibrio sp.]
MQDYETTWRNFRWEIPKYFNFAVNVVDYWAQDQDKLALIWCNQAGEERRYTFADVSSLSSQVANLLASSGLVKGDKVIVMLPRIPEWQIVMVGCLRMGVIPIPSVTMLTEKDLDYRIDHADVVGVFTTPDNILKFNLKRKFKLRISVGNLKEERETDWINFETALAEQSEIFVAPKIRSGDPAILYYTSGSTGKPKGVLHASRAIFAWRVSAWYWLDLSENDTIWCSADTGWSKSGTSVLFGPWSCGAAAFTYDGPFEPEIRLKLLQRYKVTVFCAAATELRHIIQQDITEFDLSALRLTVSAGESVNPEIVTRWCKMTSGGPLLDGYGQTETLMTILNYPCMLVKPGAMGRPLPGIETAVIDDRNEFLPADKTGRLVIKLPNPQMMLEYLHDAKQTSSCRVMIDSEEWFITGDEVQMDKDGYLFYKGRGDDVINSAGYRIGPLEVENALMEHPAVRECAAVASPDSERGQVVKAFIVLNESFLESDDLIAELKNFSKKITAPYKYPRKIEFVKGLPKTVSGKIQRRKLKNQEFGHLL